MYIFAELHLYVHFRGAPPPEYIEAAPGHWQAARNTSMHHYICMQLSALAPSPSPRSHRTSSNSGLFRGGVLSAAMCRSRGPPPASSSPLGAYSSPAGHRITPHNLTNPLYFPLSTYILVEHRPPEYGQRLDCVSGHHMTSISHLIRSRHTLSILIHSSIFLRNTDMHQYTHISRFV